MTVLLTVLATVLAWEAARFAALRLLRRRWQRSIGEFLRKHKVELEHFRFIDRVWVRQTLLQDPEIDRLAAERAASQGVTVGEVRAQVEEYLDEIVPYFNLFSYYKLGAGVARTAVRIAYELVFDAESLQRARASVPRGAVTVYVANHRSNADYIVLSVGALRQVALSYAVGEWALVWPLDTLFRSFGSYFVRRGEKDPLYHRVLARYLQLVAARGLTTAFFLEGRLSRDGKLCEPKIGLLDYLVGMLRLEPDREIVFVPVGINYDRVLEDRNLLRRDFRPTPMDYLRSLSRVCLRAPGVLIAAFSRAERRSHLKYGYAAVGIGAPIPLSSVLPDAAAVARLSDSARRPAIAGVADRLMAAIAEAIPATPVALTCRALLNGATEPAALKRAVREGIADRRARGLPIAFGVAFTSVAAGRARIARPDEPRNIQALDEDIVDAEEAERTVDLALAILRRRDLVVMEREGIRVRDPELVRYYADSLSPPSRFATTRSPA
jgi:glycerol-3-phosphate O-acyltransferase